MIRLRPSGADEVLIKRVRDWYDPGPGAFIATQSTFSPLSLFASGAQGMWYDPSDFSTMFQDSAGTIPVTAVGQSVGKILDKSGRGNHATQATASNQPILQQDSSGRYYLLFNGTSSSMVSSTVDFTTSNKMFTSVGVRKLADSDYPAIIELSTTSDSSNGSFGLFGSVSAANGSLYWQSRGAGGGVGFVQTTAYTAPTTRVISSTGDISAPRATVIVNGSQVGQSAASQGTGNYGNYPLYIGARGGTSLFFNGQLYQLIVVGKSASATEISSTESYINQKTGAY